MLPLCPQRWRSDHSRMDSSGPGSSAPCRREFSSCWTGSGSSTPVHQLQTLQNLICVCVFMASLCSGTLFEGGSVDVFTMVKNIYYPRDPQTHMITAAVHPDLQVQNDENLSCGNVAADERQGKSSLSLYAQDRDFCLLHPGDPMFLSFSGETLRYRGKAALYPFFINEAAYYEKGVALSLARKRRVGIPSVRSDTQR